MPIYCFHPVYTYILYTHTLFFNPHNIINCITIIAQEMITEAQRCKVTLPRLPAVGDKADIRPQDGRPPPTASLTPLLPRVTANKSWILARG